MSEKRKKAPLTQLEMEFLVKEFTARLKDTLYMNAEHKVREALMGILPQIWETPDATEFSISFKVEMVHGDIIQVIGRLRREVGDK